MKLLNYYNRKLVAFVICIDGLGLKQKHAFSKVFMNKKFNHLLVWYTFIEKNLYTRMQKLITFKNF